MAHWTSGSLIILLKLHSYIDAHTLGRVSPTQSSNSSRQVSRHSAEELSVYLNCLHWPLDTGFLAFSLSISIFSIPSLVCLAFGFRFNWSVNSFVHIYGLCSCQCRHGSVQKVTSWFTSFVTFHGVLPWTNPSTNLTHYYIYPWTNHQNLQVYPTINMPVAIAIRYKCIYTL